MKLRTSKTYLRFGSLFSVLILFVAVNACRTVEPKSPEIEEEESFDEPISDSDDEDTSWENIDDDQQNQGLSDLDSPDGGSSQGSAPVKTTHNVQPGESLWDISEKYYGRGIYWRAIRDHNNLSSGQINAGQTLEIPELTPQRKDQLRSMAADQSGGSTGGTSGTSSSAPGMYVTQKGDTFWKIAKREYGSGAQWKRIWRANKSKVPNPDKLKAGTKIRIPGRGAGSAGKGGGAPQKGQKGAR